MLLIRKSGINFILCACWFLLFEYASFIHVNTYQKSPIRTASHPKFTARVSRYQEHTFQVSPDPVWFLQLLLVFFFFKSGSMRSWTKRPRNKLTILLDLITQCAMPEAGGHPVHHQRTPLLQPGFNQQRRWRRGYREGEREGVSDRVDEHEPELGTELAVQLRAGGPVSLLPRCSQRPPLLHLLEHRSLQLAVRPNLRRQKLQSLKKKEKKH